MVAKEQLFDKAVTHIKREGINELIYFLKNETDFFTAPASTNFHGNYEHGLLHHSINVLEYALTIFNYTLKKKPDLEYLKESVIISSLFHDVCKVNCYSKEEKWTKDSKGKWVSYKGWVFKDDFPMPHGPKSVYLISKYMKLTNPEALAISWHQGTYDPGACIEGPTKWSYNAASEHPLVRIIHAADLMAVMIEDKIDHKSIASK